VPEVIDLALAGVAPDGTLIYDSPLMAGLTRLILEHPQEIREVGGFTLRLAGLAGVVGAILYFAGEPPKKSRSDAPRRIPGTR
jgi:hypothetical protein